MDVYVLDSLLRRIQVFDRYESMIWTERFSDVGDFELLLKSTPAARGAFTEGTRIAINNSYRVMTVKTVEDTTDTDGKEILHVKGFSIEDILNDRVVRNALTDLTTEPSWTITNTPANVARTMFDHICRTGALSASDVIPFLQPGTIFSESTIPESTSEIVWDQQPDFLFTAIKAVCDLYDMGFRLVRNFDSSQLYFDIYTGSDRTSGQSILPPVIFDVDMTNLQNTTEFTTIAGSKNVAYVFSAVGYKVVYGENVDPDVDGFEKRIIFVNATDVTVDTPDIDGALTQAGMEALMANRAQSYFDGELNENGDYRYGVDYELGDLVELRNKDGVVTYKRVTEQIFVCDSEGERSYPTLTMDVFTSINSWLAWDNDPTKWVDLNASLEAWADLT